MNSCFSPIYRPKFPIWPISCLCTYIYSVAEVIISQQRIPQLIFFEIIHLNYFSYGWLLYCIKHWLQDYRCMGKPNSISGHTFFMVYFGVLFIHSYYRFNKNKPFFQKISLIILEICLALCVILTYLGGYHTMKQVIYGFFFPILPVTQIFLFNRFTFRQQLLYHSAIYFLFLVLGLSTTLYPPSFILFTLPSLIFFGSALFTSTLVRSYSEEKSQEKDSPPNYQDEPPLSQEGDVNYKFENI